MFDDAWPPLDEAGCFLEVGLRCPTFVENKYDETCPGDGIALDLLPMMMILGDVDMNAGLSHSGEQVDVRRSARDEFVDVDDLMVVGFNETIERPGESWRQILVELRFHATLASNSTALRTAASGMS